MITKRQYFQAILHQHRIQAGRPAISSVAYAGSLFCGGVQQIQLRTEDREDVDLGSVAPLVRGFGGNCNLLQEISFHIVKFS